MSVAYLASASGSAVTAASVKKVTIPSSVVAGTFMLLAYTGSQTYPDSDPAGWTPLTTGTAGTVYAKWWYRIATSTDHDTDVTVTAASNAKTALTLACYSGVDTTTPIAAYAVRPETAASTTHADPASLSTPTGWSGIVLRSLAVKDTSTAVSTTYTPGRGTLRVSVTTGGVSGVASAQGSLGSDTSAYVTSNWTVDASSQHAVTLAVALTTAGSGGGGGTPPANPNYRGAMTGGNDGSTSGTTSATLTLPATAAAGDTAIILGATNSATAAVTAPAGWHLEADQIMATNNRAYLFSKRLTSADITAGTVTLSFSSGGRAIAAGVVLYGLDSAVPVTEVQAAADKTATLTAPVVSPVATGLPVLMMTSARTLSGAPSAASTPTGWTRQVSVATGMGTAVANMALTISTMDGGSFSVFEGGESVSFSGPTTTTDANEIIFVVATQLPAAASTARLLYRRSGSSLVAVTLAKRSGSSVVLL